MKDFELTPKMLTLSGVFYPTGYAVILFPDLEAATRVARELQAEVDSVSADMMLLTPAAILSQIGKADDQSDVELPSVGTEGATVRKFIDLARQGHHAVMVKIDSDEEAERLMVAARAAAFSYGQRYHLLAMEDLE